MINLKNEVFMRNLLHRQAAQLHHATLSYASDSPAMTAYLAPHEHTHKKFPERLAPFKSHPRPPTAFTEVCQGGLRARVRGYEGTRVRGYEGTRVRG